MQACTYCHRGVHEAATADDASAVDDLHRPAKKETVTEGFLCTMCMSVFISVLPTMSVVQV